MCNQIMRINKYIIDFGSITRLEAMRDLGVGNFGARYTEMIQAGYPLKSKWEHGKNRYGEPTLYKRYYYDESRLPKEPREAVNGL